MIKLFYLLSSLMLVVTLVSFLLLFLPTTNNLAEKPLQSRPRGEIDFSCQTDDDCQIKNVGNQCGYYPMCVNKNFIPNPPELDSLVCGFPTINQCRCLENKCQGFLE